jgi:hypothetical protein
MNSWRNGLVITTLCCQIVHDLLMLLTFLNCVQVAQQ